MKYFIIFLIIVICGMAAGIVFLHTEVSDLQKTVNQLETSLHGSLPSLGEPSIKDRLDECQAEIDEYGLRLDNLEDQMDSLESIVSQDVSILGDILDIIDNLQQRMTDVEWDISLLKLYY